VSLLLTHSDSPPVFLPLETLFLDALLPEQFLACFETSDALLGCHRAEHGLPESGLPESGLPESVLPVSASSCALASYG